LRMQPVQCQASSRPVSARSQRGLTRRSGKTVQPCPPLAMTLAARGKEACGRSLGLYLPANDVCAGNNPAKCVWTHWIQQSMHWWSKALTMKDLKCGSTRILPFRTRAFQKHSYLRKSATDRIEARANCPKLFDGPLPTLNEDFSGATALPLFLAVGGLRVISV
jgi:hypothetical protein